MPSHELVLASVLAVSAAEVLAVSAAEVLPPLEVGEAVAVVVGRAAPTHECVIVLVTRPLMLEELREQLHEETEHPARALSHAASLPAGLFTTPPAMNASMLAQVQCVEMLVRVPQSVQSEPRGQTWIPDPAPPSSHSPSLANEHASEHA